MKNPSQISTNTENDNMGIGFMYLGECWADKITVALLLLKVWPMQRPKFFLQLRSTAIVTCMSDTSVSFSYSRNSFGLYELWSKWKTLKANRIHRFSSNVEFYHLYGKEYFVTGSILVPCHLDDPSVLWHLIWKYLQISPKCVTDILYWDTNRTPSNPIKDSYLHWSR